MPPVTLSSRHRSLRGLISMALASVFFSAMSSFVYAARLRDPGASSLMASFIRVTINLAIVILIAAREGKVGELFGDRRFSLWLRGLFGGAALMTGFFAISEIGAGEATFLQSSQGVFVILLSPLILGQKVTFRAALAVLGALVGVYLLSHPRLVEGGSWGRTAALSSGILMALAYLMVARSGRSNSASTVVFYFTIIATGMHLGLFLVFPIAWPTDRIYLLLIFGAAICATVGQYLFTYAYQSAPAPLVAAVSYMNPVVTLVTGVFLFAKVPDIEATIGAILILLCGVALPFLQVEMESRRRVRVTADEEIVTAVL